jgi:hypothetical protein
MRLLHESGFEMLDGQCLVGPMKRHLEKIE